MKVKLLQSYSNVVISVHRKGHGVEPGVYNVGETVSYVKATALLNDKKAKLLVLNNETISSPEPVEEPVSAVVSEPVSETPVVVPRKKRKSKRNSSKSAKTKEQEILEDNGSDAPSSEEIENEKIDDLDPWGEDLLDINLE